MSRIELEPVGTVESPLRDLAAAPKQGDEGAPDAWLVFEPAMVEALEGIRPGDEVIVLTWLDRARRDVLRATPAATRRGPSRASSARARHTGRTRSACTA